MADNVKKSYTVVLASEGMDKIQAQIQAMNSAATAFDGTVERMGRTLNANSGTVKQSFKVMTSDATAFKKVVEEINKALLQQGGLARVSPKGKTTTDLVNIKENKSQTTSPYSDQWKAENALRAAANRQREKEEQAAARRMETEERARLKRATADYTEFWKQALREREQAEALALSKRQNAAKAEITRQQQELANAANLSRTSALYGPNSKESALARAAIQERQIKASLESQINKIQSKFLAGDFGERALKNRLGKAFADATAQINNVNKSLEGHRRVMKGAEDSHRSFAYRVIESIGIYRIFNSVLNTVIAGFKSIPQIGIALSQTTATLEATFGSYGQAAKGLQFLNEEADRTGLRLTDLRKSFSVFSASALLAGQSAASVKKIFSDMNTVSTTLHLGTQQVSNVFLALSQIFNKGKLHAEELTKQLSQVLPGITNQAAAALNMTAAQLGEAMKKGLITADEAVEKIMARMATVFGGTAFEKAAGNLNAELGRLSTAWTRFGENVAVSTEKSMIAVIKSLTGVLKWFENVTSNAYDNQRALTFWGTAVVAALGVAGTAFAGLAIKAKLASTALLEISAAGKAARATFAKGLAQGAFVSGLILMVSAANDAATSLRRAREEGQLLLGSKAAKAAGGRNEAEFAFQQEGSTQISQGNIERIQARLVGSKGLPGALKLNPKEAEKLGKELNAIRENLSAERKKFFEQWDRDQQKAEREFEGEDIEKIRLQYQARLAKNSGNKTVAAQLAARAAAVADITKINDEIARAEKALQVGNLSTKGQEDAKVYINEMKGQLADIEKSITSTGSGKGAISSALRAEFKDALTAAQEGRNNIQAALGDLDNLYTNSGISIAEYFAKQQSLYQQDFDLQREALQSNLQRAQAANDVNRVAETKLQLSKLEGEASRKNKDLITEESKAYLSLASTLRQVHYEYEESQGRGGERAAARFAKDNAERVNALMLAYGSQSTPANVRDSAGRALQEIASLGKTAEALDEAGMASVRFSAAKELLAEKEERIQNALRVGSISELTALAQTDAARKESIKVMEQWVEAQAKALQGQPEDSPAVIQLRKARLELETLESQSSLFGQNFKRIFSDNFVNGFREFRTGAASAKEAFQTFAAGVIDNIADIATQEAAVGIFNLISRGVSNSGLGGALGSLFTASAKGNAYSGTSGHAGTILSQPTIFPGAQVIPFAKGGIMAGEAGKEVVLPLDRGPDGKLGVKGTAGSGSGTTVYNISVPVTIQGNASETDADMLGGKLARAIMRQIAKEEIASAKRPGNSLNKAVY